MFTRQSNFGKNSSHLYQMLLIGIIYSLSIAFIDMTLAIGAGPKNLSDFLIMTMPVVTSIIFNFVIFLAASLPALLLRKIAKLDFLSLFVSVSIFLGVIFILRSLRYFSITELDLESIFRLSMVLFVALIAAVSSYFAAKEIYGMPDKTRDLVQLFVFALPLLFVATMVLIWFHVYHISASFSLLSLAVKFGYLFCLGFIFILLRRFRNVFMNLRFMLLFTALILLSPLLMIFKSGAGKNRVDSNHKLKHIIFLTVDTLRPDALSCYGNDSLNTPHIDQLARDGILFTNAISAAPWTLPSFASMMTGLSPFVHQAIHSSSKLSGNFRTLAEYFQDAGYYTAAIGINPVLLPHSNMSQGFQEYNFYPKSLGHSMTMRYLRNNFKRYYLEEATTNDLTQLTITWLKSNYQTDFFLWIHYYDPHAPYEPPEKYISSPSLAKRYGNSFSRQAQIRGGYYVPTREERKWIKQLYEGEVLYVDDNIGKLLDALASLGIYDNSLIILASDHGEEFWEHNGFEHGHSLYNEVIHIPLIIKLPGSKVHRKITQRVSGTDLLPTILDISGVPYKPEFLSGKTLTTFWKDDSKSIDSRPIVSTGLLYGENKESIIFDDFKYIHTFISDYEELYNLATDPGERTSVAASQKMVTSKGKNFLHEQKNSDKGLRDYFKVAQKEYYRQDKQTLEKLKSLGYVK